MSTWITEWNASDDGLYGLCYEHTVTADLDLKFCDIDGILDIADKVQHDEVHIGKEAMTFGVTNNCKKKQNSHIVLAWPSCSHSDTEIQGKLIYDVSNKFKEKNGAPFLNWSTDGDATRRIIFDSFMNETLSPTSPIYEHLSTLKLLNLGVGPNEETVNFVQKHLCKRMRNSMISGNCKVGGIYLTRDDMTTLLSTIPTENHSVDALINPADKQNVPLATDFLATIFNNDHGFSYRA